MIPKLKQATIIFNIIAIIILGGSIALFNLFEQVKEDIQTIAINSQIQYIDNITNNVADVISKSTTGNLYESLKNTHETRKMLENSLELLITKRYKYVYVVDKEKNNMNEFRFLLDGSKEKSEKSEFEEPYIPLNIDVWNNVYKTKTANYFKHDGIKNIWITYLKPIIINSEVSGIIVIDFSLQTSEMILSSLNELSIAFKFVLLFSIIIFFVIVGFSYIDTRREKVKRELHSQLINTNIALNNQTSELEEKSFKISQFNKTLTQKVKEEVAKNREKDKQMLHQSRLAQMGEMIGMIAHQWRQPLAAISSTSAGMNLKAKLNKLDKDTAIELSAKVLDYSQDLSNTIDDFRDFFKSHKEKKEITYDEVLQSVLNIVEVSIVNKNIRIIKEFNSKVAFVTYPNELKQVVLNLVKNAEDVLIEKKIANPTITISTQGNALHVSDNAGGVPKDIIDKIFDPYFSTKINKDGTGLGLYMSKTIVEEHCGGKLSVSNTQDGAIFTIELRENK